MTLALNNYLKSSMVFTVFEILFTCGVILPQCGMVLAMCCKWGFVPCWRAKQDADHDKEGVTGVSVQIGLSAASELELEAAGSMARGDWTGKTVRPSASELDQHSQGSL